MGEMQQERGETLHLKWGWDWKLEWEVNTAKESKKRDSSFLFYFQVH